MLRSFFKGFNLTFNLPCGVLWVTPAQTLTCGLEFGFNPNPNENAFESFERKNTSKPAVCEN